MEINHALTDSYGRTMRKLRVSLLDHCHFRCTYCMPAQVKFMDKNDWMSPEEISQICGQLVKMGIEELRLTGGEPTLRPDLMDIVQRLSVLPIKKLGLTSNGEKLLDLLPDLLKYNCRHLNISMDSLEEKKFFQITKSRAWKKVMESILAAKKMGFSIKVNAVLMKGVNEHEVPDFVAFSATTGIEVRFLELMKIGEAGENYDRWFIPADDTISRLKKVLNLVPITVPHDSTSFNFKVGRAQIGFIASESRPFCGSCSRLRLTPKGILRACLMKTDGLNLRGVPFEEYAAILEKVLPMKPGGRIEKIDQPMYQIGG